MILNIDMLEYLIIGVCLVFSAFFSASETAITSLGTLKAKHLLEQRGKTVKQLNLWLQHPGRVLTTILIFNNVVNILASAVATDLATRHFESKAIGIATGSITFLVLIFGEIIPKSFAKIHSEKMSIVFIKIIYVIYYLSYPVVIALSEFANFILRMVGSEVSNTPPITEEELEYLVNVGERAGVLEETKKDMIVGVFDFDETKVREVMTPRPDVKSINIEATIDQALGLSIESGFSRLPVYDESGIDHIVGVLLVKDLLKVARSSDNTEYKIRELMRDPYFVPESKLIIDVFRDLKRSKNHIAIVIDEHGGTAGLVTMEDLLEEIVGEIQDEYDVEEAEVLEIEPGIFDVAGSINVDSFLEYFDLEEDDVFPEGEPDFDTLAGWVTQLIGDLPEVGKVVTIAGLNVEVTEVERQRVQRLRISKVISKGFESEEK